MIEYYFHFFVLILFGAFLSDVVAIRNPKFWLLLALIVVIIYTHDLVTSTGPEDSEDEKK